MPKAVTIHLTPDQLARVRYHAGQAELGGRSEVRGVDRQAKLRIDQFVGQAAEAAWHLYQFGDLRRWEWTRRRKNENPWQGDDGTDVFGSNVNVKGRGHRYPDKDPTSYILAVRPRELKRGIVYVHAVVTMLPDKQPGTPVYLIGWTPHELIAAVQPQQSGTFKGAHTLGPERLFPLMPLQWNRAVA